MFSLMNDHNLDDLIIDTIAPKSNKTKSALTIIALLIVILIVAIMLTKTLLKSPENPELIFEDNLTEVIAPELQLQEPNEEEVVVAKPEKEAPLSTKVEKQTPAPEEVQKPVVNKIINTPTPSQKPKKETVSVPTEVTSVPKVATAIEIKKPVKKPITKPVSRPIKKPTVTRKVPKATHTKKYYVQVSSFRSAQPSQRLLSVIKSSGFTSHVTAPDNTGYKKLLIGPYKTRTDVDKAKDVIRKRILKSAFVVER